MNTCPCCSHVLLRHISGNEVYWFCRNCWQSMPVLSERSTFVATKVISIESQRSMQRIQKRWEALSAV